MQRIQRLRIQHRGLTDRMERIRQILLTKDPCQQEEALRTLLVRFSEELAKHLLVDEPEIYRDLANRMDPALQRNLLRYSNELNLLACAYKEYETTWQLPECLHDQVELFRRETLILLDAIQRRIRYEEEVLFPALSEST